MSAPYLIISDFDGTITVDDLTNFIWDRHVPYDWRAVLTTLSREGMLSPLQMIGRGYGDVAQGPEALLAEVLPAGHLRAGFAAFLATCDAQRWPFEVLSHGLTFYIRPLLPPGCALTAFEGRFEDGRWRVELPAGMTVPAGRDFDPSSRRAAPAPGAHDRVGDGHFLVPGGPHLQAHLRRRGPPCSPIPRRPAAFPSRPSSRSTR